MMKLMSNGGVAGIWTITASLLLLLCDTKHIALAFVPSTTTTARTSRWGTRNVRHHASSNNMQRIRHQHNYRRSQQVLHMAIESMSVENRMSDDHEAEGERMAKSIALWLDDEWLPQEVHVQMGASAKASYVACRESGEAEVMSIMFSVASDLEKNWAKYDADAFVNAWNIGNYVSDYLTKRAGIEGCECSSVIFEPVD